MQDVSALQGPSRRMDGLTWHMLEDVSFTAESGRKRRVRLFRNGRNQAVRIPREFELPGDEVIIRKDGSRLIIEPVATGSLLGLLATLQPIDEEFPPIPDPPPRQVEI